MLFTLTIPSFAVSKEEWQKLWGSDNSSPFNIGKI